MRARLTACVVVTAVAGILVGCGTSGTAESPPDRDVPGRVATVRYVIDGDTVVVDRDTHVRLIGIDTPETDPRRTVECFGPEATAAMRRLTPRGTRVRLVRDAEATDRYGRELAYIYRDSDALFVNAELVRGGFAAPLRVWPNLRHADLLGRLAADARRTGRGLWGACPAR